MLSGTMFQGPSLRLPCFQAYGETSIGPLSHLFFFKAVFYFNVGTIFKVFNNLLLNTSINVSDF